LAPPTATRREERGERKEENSRLGERDRELTVRGLFEGLKEKSNDLNLFLRHKDVRSFALDVDHKDVVLKGGQLDAVDGCQIDSSQGLCALETSEIVDGLVCDQQIPLLHLVLFVDLFGLS